MGLYETYSRLAPDERRAFVELLLAEDGADAALLPSAAQARLVFLDEASGGTAAYNLPWAGRIRGNFDPDSVRRAYLRLWRRHGQLRKRMTHAAGRMLALDADAPPPFAVLMREGLAPHEREAEAQGLAADDGATPFQLDGGPLVRVAVIRFAADDHLLLLNVHHAIADGWSLDILYGELARLYAEETEGTPANLPDLPLEYGDYVAWHRTFTSGATGDHELEVWREMLADAPQSINLPVDFPRPRTTDFAGANAHRTVPAGIARQLTSLALANDATPFAAWLAAFAAVLCRYSGDDDLVVGTPVAGRSSPDLADVVGLFVNTLPLRLDLSGNPTVKTVLHRIRDVALRAFEHPEIPLDRLVELVAPVRDDSRQPLFQVSYSFVPYATAAAPEFSGATVRSVQVDGTTAKFDLTLVVTEQAGGDVVLSLEYATALFAPQTAARLLRCLELVAEQAAPDGEATIASIALPHTPEVPEHPQLSSDHDNLYDLVKTAADRVPDATAITFAGRGTTYRELIGEADALAARLEASGAAPGSRVGILLERAPRLIVAMLAVLRVGAAYVPLDPAYPTDRLQYMLGDSGAALVIVDPDECALPLPPGVVAVHPDDVGEGSVPAVPAVPSALAAGRQTWAYVLYTSGTTGLPKAVVVPHGSVLAMIEATWHIFGQKTISASLAATSASFDPSVLEIFPTLGLGGTVHLVGSVFETPSGPQTCTAKFITGVPSLLTAGVQHGALDVRGATIAFGGESLTSATVEHFYRAGAHRVFNVYGPSEDSTYSTWSLVRRGTTRPRIGVSVPGSRAYLLDRAGRPVPLGAVGEIHLAGSGLACGYLGRPALTADRFLPDPFADTPGTRMYRTGDLGRCGPDGRLEYLGRIDRQVKVNGIRIELEELESTLLEVPGVEQAVAAVIGAGESARLAAYVVAGEGSAAGAEEMRELLLRTLPRHLVPAVIERVAQFPRLPNGKVDTTALAQQTAVPGPAHPPVTRPVVGETAQRVVRLWQQVLPGSTPHAQADFFTAGGNSLSALRLAVGIRQELAVDFNVADVFQARSPESMAKLVDTRRRRSATGAVLRPTTDEGLRSQLSPAQARLWYLDGMQDSGVAYNIPVGYRIKGELDVAALASAFEEVCCRHASLRTRIRVVDGVPRTYLAAVEPMARWDRSGTEGRERDDLAAAVLADCSAAPFTLPGGPLVAASLATLGERDHLLVVNFHHIIADGWSAAIFERDLGQAYADLLVHRPIRWPSATVDYGDYVAWQRARLAEGAFADGIGFWLGALAGAPDFVDLRTDFERPAAQSFRGAGLSVELPEHTARRLAQLEADHGVTPFMSALALFGLLLIERADTDDVLIGTPVSGRSEPELNEVFGLFVNTAVMRVDGTGNPVFEDLLARVGEFAVAAYRHQDVPLDMIVETLKPRRSAAYNPLFQVTLSYEYTDGSGLSLGPARVTATTGATGTSKFDLSLTVTQSPDGRRWLGIEYDSDLFRPDTVTAMADRFRELADIVCADPRRRISELVDRPDQPDRTGLRTAADTGAQQPTAPRGPSDDTERRVLALWNSVLPRASWNVHDDFFDVGGHSLSAMSLLAVINRGFAIALPPAVLFEAPTVARLAERVRMMRDDGTHVAVGDGTERGAAVVLVPSLDGDPYVYSALVRELVDDVVVRALDATALSLEESSALPSLVRAYRDQLLDPGFKSLVVAGWSMGGVVARALALELQDAGLTVGVVIIDSDPPPVTLPSAELLALAANASDPDGARGVLLRFFPESATSLSRPEKLIRLAAGLRALVGSEPQVRAIDGVYVRRGDAADPEAAAYWNRMCGGLLRVRTVPGGHFDLVGSEHAAALAGIIRTEVQRAARRPEA